MQVGEQINVGGATVRKVKGAQPAGEYRATQVDEQKAAADFRLISVGSKNTIVWASGEVQHVTDAKLAKIQASHSWTTDF